MRQRQAILFALQCFPGINRTKLMKFIFYVDLFSFVKQEYSILEDTYILLPNGPVPQFGFETTTMTYEEDSKDCVDFTIYRIRDKSQENIYYYRFEMNSGRFADMDVFQEGERDLLSLTLRSVMSRNTADVIIDSRSYSFWEKHRNGDVVNVNEFMLTPAEVDQLELFLSTKVYLSPMRKPRGWTWKQRKKTLIQGFPERMPVYFNEVTGEIIP